MNVLDSSTDDPYQPLSLPMWFEPAVDVDSPGQLRSDWIDAVKERINYGEPGEEIDNKYFRSHFPDDMAEEVLAVNVTMTGPQGFEARAADHRAFGVETVIQEGWITLDINIFTLWTKVSMPAANQYTFVFLIDHNVMEINVNGWTTRVVGPVGRMGAVKDFTAHADIIHAGWTVGHAEAAQADPPTTTTTTTAADTTRSTTGPGSGPGSGGVRAKASVAMVLFFSFFIR
eukprot:Polyplicarium_translucidae@DN3328_c3_g1_i4.p1